MYFKTAPRLVKHINNGLIIYSAILRIQYIIIHLLSFCVSLDASLDFLRLEEHLLSDVSFKVYAAHSSRSHMIGSAVKAKRSKVGIRLLHPAFSYP